MRSASRFELRAPRYVFSISLSTLKGLVIGFDNRFDGAIRVRYVFLISLSTLKGLVIGFDNRFDGAIRVLENLFWSGSGSTAACSPR